MEFRFIYDIKHIQRIIDRFIEAISQQPKQQGKPVSFANGYMEYAEGYKLAAYVKAKDILNVEHWMPSMIKSGEIAKRAIKAVYIKENNFVFKSQKILFKEVAEADPTKTGQVIFDFFLKNDDAANLEAMAGCFGRRYDIISYWFYLKDPDTYFPCKPRKFGEAFSLLGIDKRSLNKCTYENYSNYNEALKELATLYSEYVGHINTLDAHSFAWTISQNPAIKNYIINSDDSKNADKSDCSAEKKEGFASQKIRINQSLFRKNVVSYWDGRCAVTDCGMTDILEAAHIKSWKDCKLNSECISADNGLLLTPNLHTLFDQGLISFAADGTIMISKRLCEDDKRILGIDESMKLRIISPDREHFMCFHRTKVFF